MGVIPSVPMSKVIDPVQVLRDVLRDHNVSQAEFADEAGLSHATVNRWLNRRVELTERKLSDALSTVGIAPSDYGLQEPGLPKRRGGADKATGAGQRRIEEILVAELAAADERARVRHEELLAELRRIGNAVDALDLLGQDTATSVGQILEVASERRGKPS